MNDEQPPDRVPIPKQRRVDTVQIIGGGVAGFLSSWLLIALTIIGMISTTGTDSASTKQNVVAFVLVSLPAVIAVAVLMRTRTRYLGAGLLMGFAIGYILGAGVCAGVGVVSG